MLSHGFVLSPAVLLVLLPFGLWSFGLRTARWHTLLGRLVPKLSPILSPSSEARPGVRATSSGASLTPIDAASMAPRPTRSATGS